MADAASVGLISYAAKVHYLSKDKHHELPNYRN